MQSLKKAKNALTTLERALRKLEEGKRRVGEIAPARLEKIVEAVARRRFSDAMSLARFHEALLFLRAYPPDRNLLRAVEELLRSFSLRVEKMRKDGVDFSPIDREEFSGIAGTTLTSILNYDEARWLVERFPKSVSIDWDGYEKQERLASALPRFIPLLEEDSFVEPDVPYRKWIREASCGRESLWTSGESRYEELRWLIRQCSRLPVSAEQKIEIFGELELLIRWELGNVSATRTLARRPVRRIFYQTRPMIRRSEVSLAGEIMRPPLKVEKLSSAEGSNVINFCREAMTVRYRELYGTTLGDPLQVMHVSVGRGVELYLWGLLPKRRLPLRAYQAGITLKNGVPVNYVEAISLFEWMEIGFNIFYNYRDGESAWIYAQTLRLLHQLLGVTCISVYPYQIGKDNEEAIDSGAFWFYRKLGFRPMRPDLAKIVDAEEAKIAADRAYRTPRETLRRLAQGHLVFELPGSEVGQWDDFRMRNIGFAVQRRMAERFDGDAGDIRDSSRDLVAKILGIRIGRLSDLERRALENYSLVLSLIPDITTWSGPEKNLLWEIIRAKAGPSELRYAQHLQRHSRLRAAILKIGSFARR